MTTADMTKTKILEIENVISHTDIDEVGISLFSGYGGVPLFYFMLYKLTNDKAYILKTQKSYEKLFEKINDENYDYTITYCNGLVGFAYLTHFLTKQGILDSDSMQENLEIIDRIVYENTVEEKNSIDDIDFLHGALGVAFYLNERQADNPTIKTSTKLLFEKISDIIIESVKDAKKNENITEINQDTHKVNCGMAHGYVSYISILSGFLLNSGNNDKVKNAVDKSLDLLLSFETENYNAFSVYPGIAVNKKTAIYNIPLGWCYGDQTISTVLYKVSNILKSDSLYTKALAIAKRNLSRNTYDKMFPVTLFDEAFCHGLASVAYLHKKWYKITGDEKFYNLYEFLIKDIVERGDKIDGLAGYKKIINRNETINSIGLLDGVVGIGIVLIDYLLGDNNTGWDSFFLLD